MRAVQDDTLLVMESWNLGSNILVFLFYSSCLENQKIMQIDKKLIANKARAYPDFSSTLRLGISLLPPG